MTFSGSDAKDIVMPWLHLLDIQEFAIEAESNHTVSIKPTFTVPSMMEISVLPVSGVFSGDNGQDLVTFSLDEIYLPGNGSHTASSSLRLYFDPTTRGAETMGDIVRKAVMAIPSFISLGSLKFSGPSDTSAMNHMFSIVRLRFPVHSYLYAALLREAPDQVVSIASAHEERTENVILKKRMTIPEALETSPLLELLLRGGAFAVEGDSFILNGDFDIDCEVPLVLNFPFLSVNLGIDNLDAVTVEAYGLSLSHERRDLRTRVETTFSKDESIPGILSNIVTHALENTLLDMKHDLVVRGIRFGPNSRDAISLYSKLDIKIPGFSFHILRNQLLQTEEGSQVQTPRLNALNLVNIKLPFDVASLNLRNFQPTLKSLQISVDTGELISTKVSVGFLNLLPFSVHIPHFELSLLSDSHRMISLSIDGVSATANVWNEMNISVLSRFSNEETVSSSVQQLIQGLLHESNFGGLRLSLGDIRLGANSVHAIEAFRDIELSIPAEIFRPGSGHSSLLSVVAPWIPPPNLELLALDIENADIKISSSGSVIVDTTVSFVNPLPISVFCGHASFLLNVNSNSFMEISFSPLRLLHAEGRRQKLTVSTRIGVRNQNISSAPLAELMRMLFSGVGFDSMNSPISLSGLRFGPSPRDLIQTFRHTSITLPIPCVKDLIQSGAELSVFQILAPWRKKLSMAVLLPQVEYIDILGLQDGLSIDSSINLKNSPISISVGYISFKVVLGEFDFFAATFSNLNIPRESGSMKLKLSLSFSNNRGLEQIIADLSRRVFVSGDGFALTNSPLAVTDLKFGNFAADNIFLLQDCVFPIPIPADLRDSMNVDGASLSSIYAVFPWLRGVSAESFAPSVSVFNLSTISTGIEFTFAAEIINPLPLSVSLGHISTQLSVRQDSLVDIEILGLDLVRNMRQDVRFSARILFGDGESIETGVSELVNSVVRQGKGFGIRDSPLKLAGLEFGTDRSSKISIFRHIGLPIPIPKGKRFDSDACRYYSQSNRVVAGY